MHFAFASRLAWVSFCCLIGAAPGVAQPMGAYEHLVLDGARLKWGAPVAGSEAVVTYAIVSDAHRFPGARNCPLIVPPDAMLLASGVSRSAFDREVRSAFSAWSAVADIVFRPTETAGADILIGAQMHPRGRAFTNVEYQAGDLPRDGIRTLDRSVICLSPAHRWKIGFDGNLAVYDLRYTLIHEIGHAIGLNHPETKGQVMDFRYGETFRNLQPGDIEGVARLYGPASADQVAVHAGARTNRGEASLALDDDRRPAPGDNLLPSAPDR